MTRDIHIMWPVAALAASVLAISLQIPRKALFFHASEPSSSRPFASFVSYDDDVLASILRRARMSWQIPMRTGNAGGNIRVSLLETEELQPSTFLPLPKTYAERVSSPELPGLQDPISPPSQALPLGSLTPAAETRENSTANEDLLALPPSLQSE